MQCAPTKSNNGVQVDTITSWPRHRHKDKKHQGRYTTFENPRTADRFPTPAKAKGKTKSDKTEITPQTPTVQAHTSSQMKLYHICLPGAASGCRPAAQLMNRSGLAAVPAKTGRQGSEPWRFKQNSHCSESLAPLAGLCRSRTVRQ